MYSEYHKLCNLNSFCPPPKKKSNSTKSQDLSGQQKCKRKETNAIKHLVKRHLINEFESLGIYTVLRESEKKKKYSMTYGLNKSAQRPKWTLRHN